ncbi:adenylate/guanylate cyclase domain-containing protein [Coraliomargarita akajimensis]|uniref:Adenylate/guanylate cyclase with Chase sensor n=1 Tax=Coraliomargarita akajimensis (strain DSM 45221 / IAM 15411 / JCM 23193 / KCTC 12865 / 04OKA010-24) TaxID=583355 RepID=D5EKC9_CORAD|nr:adenylate/guanylate cyclase domain-containing protein [Coraliomargarita akajimensis]ADE54878.1 adenylate/guanylate cyclase with Chase sensor [Coraliomargarita akajimensis DSM 45221]
MNRLQQVSGYVCLVALSIVLWLGLGYAGVLSGLEQEALRWRYLVRGERSSEAPIVFVDLDADAIAKIGDQPWDRLNFAQTIQALIQFGDAKVVGVDLIFSQFGGGSLLDVDRARSGDKRFGEVVAAFSEQVVLAAAYTGTTSIEAVLPLQRDGYTDPTQVPFPEGPSYPIVNFDSGRIALANVDEALNEGSIPHMVVGQVEIAGERFSRHLMDGKLRYFSGLLNEPKLEETEDRFRLVDQDGFPTDSIPRYSEQRLLTLGLEVFLAAHGLGPDAVEVDGDTLLIWNEGELFRRIPLIQGQSIEVNWFEGWNTKLGTPHTSMAEVLERAHWMAAAHRDGDVKTRTEHEDWFEQFKGKVVFIGPVDATLKDIAPTPYDRIPVPKVGLHANMYRTIQAEAYIRTVGAGSCVVVVVLLTSVVSLLALWSGKFRELTRLLSLLLPVVYLGLVMYAFGRWNLILPLLEPIGAALTAALFVLLLKVGAEEWQRRRIKSMFGAYLSPELVNEMVESRRDPELGGTQAEITALFSDVEGFSMLSELLSPDELVTLMNEYLGAMTEELHVEGGTLDKYIGDAIVTMFGMPIPDVEHAAKACLGAIRMQERHAALREEWSKGGRWPVEVSQMRTRIGLNTGNAVVGNMGSRVRFSYTMMGDSVNLAARCESGAKFYGIYTMLTDATVRKARQVLTDLRVRRLDRIVVKGKSEPIEVYELWDSSMDCERFDQCRELYESAFDRYLARDWAGAVELFTQALEVEPLRGVSSTTPSAVLLARSRELLEQGVPDRWDGVYRMRTK